MTKLRTKNHGLDLAARIGKAMDHPLRIRAVAALRERELCVCELIELFGLSPSTVSKHMSIVADGGLVDRRRDGKWTYYSLPLDPDAHVAHAIAAIMTLVEDDPLVLRDREIVSKGKDE
jgi:ArsR family transcriptional regulator